MVRELYFDHLPNFCKSNAFNIDSSIGSAIRNSSGLTMRKVIESRDDRTEVTVDTVNSEEKVKKSVSLWENFGYFGTEPCDFSIEKANLPENTLFYINPAYQSFKDGKKVYYNDVFILAQIMPLAHQPKDIGSYQLNDNEVKTLRSSLQFFDYSYHKENSKVLYSTRKLKVPNSFKTTIFGQHRMQYEEGAFDEQKFSKLFSYLPATVDRNEKINKYLTSVHLKPFHFDPAVFGEKFNPADLDFDRSAVVSYMKKVAQQSSQNLKRNADAFLSSVPHNNGKLLWLGGKRTHSDKFALTY